MLGQISFSDYALNVASGTSPYTVVDRSESSQILNSLIEQIRYEKGGTAGAFAPVRVFIDGDMKGQEELFNECLVEEAVDKNTEFPYQDFLCMLHKRIRTKIQDK